MGLHIKAAQVVITDGKVTTKPVVSSVEFDCLKDLRGWQPCLHEAVMCGPASSTASASAISGTATAATSTAEGGAQDAPAPFQLPDSLADVARSEYQPPAYMMPAARFNRGGCDWYQCCFLPTWWCVRGCGCVRASLLPMPPLRPMPTLQVHFEVRVTSVPRAT